VSSSVSRFLFLPLFLPSPSVVSISFSSRTFICITGVNTV
jgi:hypothetical protein